MSMETELDFSNEAKTPAAGGVPKNFRQQADIEAFYRFVHENDLREQALEILDKTRAQRALAKMAKRPKN